MGCQTSTKPSDAQRISYDDLLEAWRALDRACPPLPSVIVTTYALLVRVMAECDSRVCDSAARSFCPSLGVPIIGYRDAAAAKAAASLVARKGRRVLLVTEGNSEEVGQ